MGKFATDRVEWFSEDKMCNIVVSYVMGHEMEPVTTVGRIQYTWEVYKMEPGPMYVCVGSSHGTNDHILSGVGEEANAMEGLRSFSGFVEAWIEACNHESSDDDTAGLFPITMYEIMDEYHDELHQDTHVYEYIEMLERQPPTIDPGWVPCENNITFTQEYPS